MNLSEINEHMFQNLTNLKKITLNGNRITKITPGSFGNTPQLAYLYLEHNDLTNLSPEIFVVNGTAHRPEYLRMNLSGNPFECDATLCWMREAERERWLRVVTVPCAEYRNLTWGEGSWTC